MATVQNDLEILELTHIEIRSNSEVQLLADLLGTRGGELAELYLEVPIPVIGWVSRPTSSCHEIMLRSHLSFSFLL